MLKFEVDPDQIEDCNMMFPKVTFILSDEAMLPEVVSAFESFLKAAGYNFDGHLDLVKDHINSVGEFNEDNN